MTNSKNKNKKINKFLNYIKINNIVNVMIIK